MHLEKYSLKWDTYSDHLMCMMKELMINEDLADVTLVTEDKKQIKANIHILSACSPFFKDILKKEKNSSATMYLRGIQSSEMESILHFIYLGEATFLEERMDEILAVAKSLEIKELCNAATKTNVELKHDPGSLNGNLELESQTVVSDNFVNQPPQEREREIVSANDKFEFKPHQKKIASKNGKLYLCDQCDYQGSRITYLTSHIQSKHEGVVYDCTKCDYKATKRSGLYEHIKFKHDDVKLLVCKKCDYQTKMQSNLKRHIKSYHKGIGRL